MIEANLTEGGTHLKKSERHAIIEHLIRTHVIHTQEELLALLKENGVTATQATISRDIRDLKIVKSIDASGRASFQQLQSESPDVQSETQHLSQLTQDVVTKIGALLGIVCKMVMNCTRSILVTTSWVN